uniref:Uncharacterized protein n=1 Tax=Rhizophora mucronata TaxID=61149 RepID=A0A2P2Q523_RHIMU
MREDPKSTEIFQIYILKRKNMGKLLKHCSVNSATMNPMTLGMQLLFSTSFNGRYVWVIAIPNLFDRTSLK